MWFIFPTAYTNVHNNFLYKVLSSNLFSHYDTKDLKWQTMSVFLEKYFTSIVKDEEYHKQVL